MKMQLTLRVVLRDMWLKRTSDGAQCRGRPYLGSFD